MRPTSPSAPSGLCEPPAKAKAKGRAKKSATRVKRVAQSLSVVEVHGKIGSSLARRLARYQDLDFGPAGEPSGPLNL